MDKPDFAIRSGSGLDLIIKERERQISEEGWTPEHDTQHKYGSLAVHAASLAVMETDAKVIDELGRGSEHVEGQDCFDSWKLQEKHKGNHLRALTIAGALIAAEIDRIQAVQ